MLTGYDRRHDDLKSLLQQAKETAANATYQSAADDDNSRRRRLVLVDLYRVPPQFVSLLRLDKEAVNAAQATSVERRNTGYLTGKEVRAILEDYIARENLVDTTNKGSVHLDGPLTDALFPTNKKQSKANNDTASSSPPPATLSRKDLVAKWQLQMQDAYALVQMPGNVILQMNRGKPPQVTITVTKRQNRKFITRVRGVEHYGVNAMHFKNDVSHRLACAASIEDSPMEKLPNKDHVELVFQGNIHEQLQALLLNDSSLSSHGGCVSGDSDYYQLPKNSINVILRKGVPGHKK
jgi:translation initiation factor 1 (eIF-1/SUI1)